MHAKLMKIGSVEAAGAGWSSLAARRAHNPKVEGSNPSPATNRLLTGSYGAKRLREIICEALE